MNYMQYDTLILNGHHLKGLEITQYCKNSDQQNIIELGLFMNDWMSDTPVMEVRTSGSTGAPKIISVEKNQMLSSAAMTADYFHFREDQKALLSLPINYIAGKMMVARALYSKLNLICVPPGNAPFRTLPTGVEIDFAPLVPMQLSNVNEADVIRQILLGGSAVDAALEERLQSFSSKIYHGYGMTETLSHVAVRHVNGRQRSVIYQALEGISFDVDERNCLLIDVPFLNRPVQTNDVVDLLNNHEFVWKGRFDFVVNSGGVKLFPEEIEKKLYTVIPERFFVAGLPDERFGEKLCLFIEGEAYGNDRFQSLLDHLSKRLDKYEKPRDVFFLKSFKMTESGKIRREETIGIVK